MSEQEAYTGEGLVKEVQSGDCVTILLSGSTERGPRQELVLTLASLEAPRLSRRNGDAPFAQQAREFLRNKCGGKPVVFKVEYKVPSIDRTFGTIFYNGEDLSLAIVEAGFAAVKEVRGGDCSGQLDDLLHLQELAKNSERGMWTTNKSKIAAGNVKIRHAGDESISQQELEEIFHKIEDRPVDAIIEYVRDGATMRVQLVDFSVVVPFTLAGVSAPSRGKGIRLADGSYDDSLAKPEPFAEASRLFLEV